MKRRSFITLTLLMMVMAIALTACSGDKTKHNEGAEDNISQENPTYGGNVVVGIQQDLDSLDPHKAVAAGTKEVLFNVFEGLVKPDEEGNLVPAVASDYKVLEDGKTYLFTIRDGVTFHNGNKVTVEDIVYSLKRSAGLLDKVDPTVVVESALKNISRVYAKDASTVVVELKEQDTELLPYLTLAIIPNGYEDCGKKPIGTGPFSFVSYTPDQSFVVAKFSDYWNQEKAAYLDGVTFKIVSNTDSAFLELQAGAIDIYPYMTSDQAAQLNESFDVLEGNMNLVQGLFLNNKKAPFDNQKVREAMNYAIDKQVILDMVAAGSGNILGSNMYSGFKKYYVDSLKDLYPYDVNRAKQLLQEAGYENGFTFTITVPSNYQYHIDTAQVIVEQLKAVGVVAKIHLVDWNTWIAETYKGRNYDATIIGLDSNLAGRDILERYGSKADNNFVNYSNPKYDQVLEEAIQSTDDEKKVECYKELQEILAKDSASVYIQDPPLLVAIKKQFGGYTFYPVYVQDMSKVYVKETK